jgi:serine/threonine protein kinase
MKELTAYAHSFSSEPQQAGAAGLGSSVASGHSHSSIGSNISMGSHGSHGSSSASSSIGSDHSLEASVASINERSAIALASLAAPPPPSAAGLGAGPDAGSKALIHFIGASYLDGKLSIFIEYMDSGSLQDLVDARGPMSEAVLRSVMRQSVAGLHTLHQRRQVHRDIKPANVLVNHRGEVKIADFGILAILDDADALCKTFVGTTLYMSPERIRGEKYGAPGDIWSIGMTAIVCANGAFPFDATGGYFGIVQKVWICACRRNICTRISSTDSRLELF